MNVGEALKTCLFEKYSSPHGRASRSEFWWFFPVSVLPVQALARGGADGTFLSQGMGEYYILFLFFIGTLFFIPLTTAAIRRFHDMGRSGWWVNLWLPLPITLIVFYFSIRNLFHFEAFLLSAGIASLSVLISLIWLAFPGTPADNRFGPSPKSPYSWNGRDRL